MENAEYTFVEKAKQVKSNDLRNRCQTTLLVSVTGSAARSLFPPSENRRVRAEDQPIPLTWKGSPSRPDTGIITGSEMFTFP